MQSSIRVHALVACTASFILSAALPSASSAQQGAVPAPESVLGFYVGADFKLATYDE